MSFSPLGLTPLIGVFDMPRALAFYRDVLGFTVVAASLRSKRRKAGFLIGCG
jgi:glyoxylase I family protein